MGFIVWFLVGAALGVGMIACFARFQNMRSIKRIELATIVAAFARMTVEDSRKILPAEAYPPWVVFSQRQKLKWLNHHLKKLWPYIDQAASEVIREKVEPTLEKYRSPIIDDLKFSKLTLGTVAPQFTGVSIIEGDPEEIIMELELQWDGNPHIVLDITTLVGVSLPIEVFGYFFTSRYTILTVSARGLVTVKDIGFTGVFRIIFKPLVEEFPCFGAICYSLRNKKKLDFTLKVCGDISTIPGVLDALKSTILDAIEDSMMWPVRNIIPILPGDYSDLQLKPVGTLEVKLIQGKELTNKDIVGKSDPFAEVFIRPQRERIKKSKVINNTLNPIWNENFEFEVEDASTQHLTVKVYDDEGIQASELIGCARVQLKELEPGKVKSVWLALVKDLEIQRDTKNRGQIHLELLYCPFGTQNIFMNFVDPDFRLTDLEKALQHGAKPATQKTRNLLFRGVLSVTVISAEDLPATDLSGKCDPYVVLILKKSEQREKTRVMTNLLNPVWNQTFDFVVEDGLHELLILEVWDHDICGKDKIGRCIMTLTRVIQEGEFTDTFELDGAESGKLHLNLMWTPQPIIQD